MGVELNAYSRPIAYWLRTQHPGERAGLNPQTTLRERVPAEEMTHIFLHDRPEQRRGFPWVASAMIGLQNLGGYQEAAIIAARVGASKMVFFKVSEDADTLLPPIDGETVSNGYHDVNLIDTVAPGTFHELPQGYDFTPFNPDYPHNNYDAFIKASLRGIASGLGVSYHSLANDLEGVNFSSHWKSETHGWLCKIGLNKPYYLMYLTTGFRLLCYRVQCGRSMASPYLPANCSVSVSMTGKADAGNGLILIKTFPPPKKQ